MTEYRTFDAWARRWLDLATYAGGLLPDQDQRIAAVVELWKDEIPPGWEREQDHRLVDPRCRYVRSNHAPHHLRRGEHVVEYDVLNSITTASSACLGGRVVDGINAIPLAKDLGGGKLGNVEADLLLLVESGKGYRQFLVEVKTTSNNAWYAVVENLRQLGLFSKNERAQTLFHTRRPELGLPASVPVTGVVLAPAAFYSARGAKVQAVAPAQRLIDRLRAETGADARLAAWSLETGIKPLMVH